MSQVNKNGKILQWDSYWNYNPHYNLQWNVKFMRESILMSEAKPLVYCVNVCRLIFTSENSPQREVWEIKLDTTRTVTECDKYPHWPSCHKPSYHLIHISKHYMKCLSSRADNSKTSWGICTKNTSCTSTMDFDDVYQVSLQAVKNWKRSLLHKLSTIFNNSAQCCKNKA